MGTYFIKLLPTERNRFICKTKYAGYSILKHWTHLLKHFLEKFLINKWIARYKPMEGVMKNLKVTSQNHTEGTVEDNSELLQGCLLLNRMQKVSHTYCTTKSRCCDTIYCTVNNYLWNIILTSHHCLQWRDGWLKFSNSMTFEKRGKNYYDDFELCQEINKNRKQKNL